MRPHSLQGWKGNREFVSSRQYSKIETPFVYRLAILSLAVRTRKHRRLKVDSSNSERCILGILKYKALPQVARMVVWT